MPTTPNLDLNLPTVGASRDTWGSLLNDNFTTLDEMLFYAMPVGAILDYAGANAPPGWLICDGRLLSRTTYSTLFAAIGTAWGAGDGATTFALPPTPGRASVGPGTMIDGNGTTLSLSFAQTLGNVSNNIQQPHLPNYAISTDVQGLHSHGGATGPGGAHTHSMDQQGLHAHSGSYLASHTHPSGTTDTQGLHQHYVYEVWGNTSFGPNFGGGGYSAQGTGYFGGYTDQQGSHAHNFSIAGSGNLGLTVIGDGLHVHNITAAGNIQLPINPDGSHSHTIYLGGSGVLFSIMQPVIVITKIIYAGTQAAALALGLAIAPTVTIEGPRGDGDELAAIREELAQLRAQMNFMLPSPRPRRLAAPLRGSH